MRKLRELKVFFCLLPKAIFLLIRDFFVLCRPMLGLIAVFAGASMLVLIYGPFGEEALPVWPLMPISVVLLIFSVVYYSSESIFAWQLFLFFQGFYCCMVGVFAIAGLLWYWWIQQQVPTDFPHWWIGLVGLGCFALNHFWLEKWERRIAKQHWGVEEPIISSTISTSG